ncbi:aminotransferase class IV [Reichenbachiella sp.]|uniref:aminotransferase class IV n=1 Tax=Reichenbachiella sp. TaxID=2184521 RepID=UPI003BB01005
MSQFIESICCIDGELQLLELHQARVNRAFFTNYGLLARPMKLSKIIRNIPRKGTYKCRVVYDKENFDCTFKPYQKPKVGSLQLVEGGDIDYKFKYTNRSGLDELFAQRKEADDIIIVKNGCITDSHFANLAFYDGEEWWTSDQPLLEGVRRQSLIDQRQLQVRQISIQDLASFEKCCLINAMLDLGQIEIPIPSIRSSSK